MGGAKGGMNVLVIGLVVNEKGDEAMFAEGECVACKVCESA